MTEYKVKELFNFLKKSKIKAGEGLVNGKFPFYTSSNILNKFLNYYEFEDEGIIFGTGGNASVHYTSGKFSVSTDCYVIQPIDTEKICMKYIYYFFLKNIYVLEAGFKGAGLKHISKKYIEEIKIPLPSIETQKKIAQVLDKAQELIDKRKEQIEKMDEFIQSVFLDMFGDPVKNPKGWEIKTVGKVCKNIFGGGTPSKQKAHYYTGDIPWVTPKDMKQIWINDSIDHITNEAIKNSSTKLIPKKSVLMVIRSGILKKKLPVAINTCEVTVNQDMKAFVIDIDVIVVQYLLFVFLSSQHYLLSKVRGVTADNIEFKQIKEMIIPIPPLDLQNKFAQIVQKTEQQKELLQKSLTELENNFNSLMQKAFKGELF